MECFKERYFLIWQRVWDFHKRFADIVADGEWEEMIEEAGKIGNESKFSKDLILAVLAEIERTDKERRKKEGECNE